MEIIPPRAAAGGVATTDHAFTMRKTISPTRRSPALALARVEFIVFVLVLNGASVALAQIDPYPRSLVQLGYDQSVSGRGPQSLYAYYYYNNPEFLSTNMALRLAVAPIYLDGEIGFRQVFSPH